MRKPIYAAVSLLAALSMLLSACAAPSPAAPPTPQVVEKQVEVTRQGFRDAHIRHAEKRTDLRGREYYWMGFQQVRSTPGEGTDLRALYEGRISVTPLHIDLTHMETVHALKGVLGGAPPKLREPA